LNAWDAPEAGSPGFFFLSLPIPFPSRSIQIYVVCIGNGAFGYYEPGFDDDTVQLVKADTQRFSENRIKMK
jgi:hypothetical protein